MEITGDQIPTKSPIKLKYINISSDLNPISSLSFRKCALPETSEQL